MVRPSLPMVAGLLVLVGLLGLSTALIAEVREQVLEPSEEVEGAPVREIQAPSRGLPVPELTLLDPTEAHIPDRERTEDNIRITGPGQLYIEPGERIHPAPFPLGEPASLALGPNASLEGDTITCTTPCRLETDTADLQLPARSTLDPPTSLEDRPTEAPLDEARSLEVPIGTRLELPPIRFPSGTTLTVEPGAYARLPASDADWGPLLEADPTRLPAGTVLHRSAVADDNLTATAGMLENARRDPTSRPAPVLAQQPSIEITQAPDTIRKGEPFEISGHVETEDGAPSQDHPVTLYANATKSAPGLALMDKPTQTDANGTFTAHVVLPEDQPARPYHLVAQAHPRSDTDPPLTVAWSDPLVGVEAEAHLDLDLPPRTGVEVPLTLRAVLQDEHGAPIPDQPVGFSIEDTDATLAARTDERGEAVTVLDAGLSFRGNYTIEAVFPGTGNLTPDRATDTIQAVQARIEATATHQAPRGQPATVEGRVIAEEDDPGSVRVTASYADNITATADTDQRGRFSLELPVPAGLEPGNHTVDVEAPAVDARHRLVLTATAGLSLDVPRPGPEPVGARVPIPVTVRVDNGTPVAGIPLEARIDDRLEDRRTTDQHGRARLSVPIAHPGSHRVTIATQAPAAYRATRTQLAIPAGPLDVTADIGVAPGGSTNATVELAVDEAPLRGAPVRLHGPGLLAQATTDEDGRAQLTLSLPPDAEPGLVTTNLTLTDRGLERSLPVRVLESPTLRVDVIKEGREGEPLQVAVHAQGSQGPLPGVPILARTEGAFQAQQRAITDEAGTANLTFPRPDGAEGTIDIDVLAERTQTTAQAAHTTSAEVTPAPLPWGWLLAGTLAVGLAGAVAYRHRRAPSPRPTDAEPSATLSLQLAAADETLGPVWHPGDPTDLDVQLTDEDGTPIPRAQVHLEGPGGSRTVRLDGEGRARTPLPPLERGTHTYRARYETEGHAVETVLEVRVVDYREEIDRQYRKLREAAARLGLVDPGATPRELAEALGPPGRELVTLFERYDYSPHPVDRGDYERFMQAREEADPRATPR